MVKVVLEQRLGLLGVGVNESLDYLAFKNLKVFFMESILQEFQVALPSILREVSFLHHLNKRFSN